LTIACFKVRVSRSDTCGVADGGDIFPKSRNTVESPLITHIFSGVLDPVAVL
jgi:hypothetical protein